MWNIYLKMVHVQSAELEKFPVKMLNMQPKHLWERLVANPTWAKISMYVEETMMYGENFIGDDNFPGKRLIIEGHTIEVKYNIVEGVLKIINAWIANK